LEKVELQSNKFSQSLEGCNKHVKDLLQI